MPKEFESLSKQVIGCAIDVHRELGPGLLESTCQACLSHELRHSGLCFQVQHVLPVRYKGLLIPCGYRVDLLVEDQVMIELKSVDLVLGIHKAQLLTYMKLSGIRVLRCEPTLCRNQSRSLRIF